MTSSLEVAKEGLRLFRASTNPPRNAYGWCQAAAYWMIVAWNSGSESGIRTYSTAREAARNSIMFADKNINQSGLAPGVMAFWDWGSDGHVGMVVGYDGNRVLIAHTGTRSSDYYLDLGYSMRISHADRMGLSFLGYSARNGSNPAITGITAWPNAPLQPHERRVTEGGPANGRSGPGTSYAVTQQIAGGDTGEFNGWIYGESVSGNNVWYRGAIRGQWFWSGGFTDTSTKGLADLNPQKPTDPYTRAANGVLNVRSSYSTDSGIIDRVESGELVKILGWAKGQSVQGIDIWFKIDKGWVWGGGFDDRSTDGLPDLSPLNPEPEPEPEDPTDYTPHIVTPSAADWPAWIRYEERLDPDATEEQNVEAARYYGVEYNPIESHAHWWDDPAKKPSHDGIVDWMLRNSELSVNFVTSANRVTLMVPLHIVAYTTGRRNPYGWKTENDPQLTDDGYKTLGFVHYLVEKLNPSLKNEAIRLHKEFTDTRCSDIDRNKVRNYAEKFASGELDPETGQPPVAPEPGKSGLAELIQLLITFLKRIMGMKS